MILSFLFAGLSQGRSQTAARKEGKRQRFQFLEQLVCFNIYCNFFKLNACLNSYSGFDSETKVENSVLSKTYCSMGFWSSDRS